MDLALSTSPPEPTYYKRMKKLNAAGPAVMGRLPLASYPPAIERLKNRTTGPSNGG